MASYLSQAVGILVGFNEEVGSTGWAGLLGWTSLSQPLQQEGLASPAPGLHTLPFSSACTCLIIMAALACDSCCTSLVRPKLLSASNLLSPTIPASGQAGHDHLL